MNEVVQESKISTVNIADERKMTREVSSTQQTKNCSVIAKSCQGSG